MVNTPTRFLMNPLWPKYSGYYGGMFPGPNVQGGRVAIARRYKFAYIQADGSIIANPNSTAALSR